MAERIVGQHADDGSGHCRLCTGGAQTGNYRWPCQTYLAAKRAAESRPGLDGSVRMGRPRETSPTGSHLVGRSARRLRGGDLPSGRRAGIDQRTDAGGSW